MISISFEMVFSAVLFSSFAGAVFGALYSLFASLYLAISKQIERRFKKQLNERKNDSIFKNLVDCFFALLVGLSYIILSYIFLDGVFEIYSLLSLIVTFLVSKKALCLILHLNNST